MNLWRRIRALVSAAKILLVQDGGVIQLTQVQLNGLQTFDNIPRMAEYGLTSNPPEGSDAVLLFLAGESTTGVVIATGHQQFRLKNLPSGAVALYDNLGQTIQLLPTGIVLMPAEGNPVLVQGNFQVNGDTKVNGNMNATGNLSVGGTITDGTNGNLSQLVAEIKANYNQHTHAVSGSSTGAPAPQVT